MKKMNTAAMAICKFFEVVHWMVAGAMAVMFLLSVAAKDLVIDFITQGSTSSGSNIATYGFELSAFNVDGTVNTTAVSVYAAGSVVMLVLMAMVFRNVYLILKTAKGKTKFSKGDTPFQSDITRMVREIGIFYISIPIVGLILSIVTRLIMGPDAAQISVSFEGVITGIIILCLSQIFAYGVQLQKDVDGLL